jgi:hypothetical protein
MEEYARILNSQDEATVAKSRRTIREYQDAVAHMEYTLGLERLSSPDLADQDLVQALDLLLDTYGTEAKGVLYEKASNDLRIEPLRKQLRNVIESLRNPEGEKGHGIVDPQNTRLPLSGAIDCLEFVRSMALAYMENPKSNIGYLDFLARITPREKKRGSILIP